MGELQWKMVRAIIFTFSNICFCVLFSVDIGNFLTSVWHQCLNTHVIIFLKSRMHTRTHTLTYTCLKLNTGRQAYMHAYTYIKACTLTYIHTQGDTNLWSFASSFFKWRICFVFSWVFSFLYVRWYMKGYVLNTSLSLQRTVQNVRMYRPHGCLHKLDWQRISPHPDEWDWQWAYEACTEDSK